MKGLVYNSYDLTLVTSKITYPQVKNLGIKNAQYTNLVGFDRDRFTAGIPVIAPNYGGVVENIQDGSNGFLYTPGDRQDFANKLQILVENSSLRQKMGEFARNSIQAYSWEQAIQNLVDVWQEAINEQLTIDNGQFAQQLATKDVRCSN